MQIDENALSIFVGMGYSADSIPPTLSKLYNAAKRKKDAVYPGRVSPEMCATLATFADVIDKRIDLTEEPEAAPVKGSDKK